MIEDTTAVSLIILPFTFIASAIWPYLYTVPMPLFLLPLAFINSTVGKGVLSLVLVCYVVLVGRLINFFHDDQVAALVYLS
jgi:hypothetical protein